MEDLDGRTSAGDDHTPETSFTRRQFLTRAGAIAGGVALTGGLAVGVGGCPDEDGEETGETGTTAAANGTAGISWDESADVVVVGSGAAAFAAAAAAVDQGADVIMLEKTAVRGGTSAKSGGAYWIPNNHLMQAEGIDDPRDAALNYMARLAYPQLYDPNDPMLGLPEMKYNLIATYYDRASEAIESLGEMGALRSQFSMALQPDLHDLPYTVDYHATLPQNEAPQGRMLSPEGGGAGAGMIEQLATFAEDNGVRLLMEHRVRRLVRDDDGGVAGVEVETSDGTLLVEARRSVVFGSGGFTHNPEFRVAFLRGPIYGGCAVPSSEGDFIPIGTEVGAKLGNMSHAWWAQIVLEQSLELDAVPNDVWMPYGHSMLMVNKYGQRVVNEKAIYNERTQAHFYWDPTRVEYPNLILFMIYDRKVAEDETQWPFRYPVPMPGEEQPWVIQGETWQELANNVDTRLAQLAADTGGLRLADDFADQVQQTVQQFNQFAEQGRDPIFMRGETPIAQDWSGPPQAGRNTMAPLEDSGPYYCIMLVGGTLDTKGGPVINGDSQVLDREDNPIPRLYGAGNCIASPAGQAYWAGGSTLGPALTFGFIAGQNAAAETVREGATEPAEEEMTTTTAG